MNSFRYSALGIGGAFIVDRPRRPRAALDAARCAEDGILVGRGRDGTLGDRGHPSPQHCRTRFNARWTRVDRLGGGTDTGAAGARPDSGSPSAACAAAEPLPLRKRCEAQARPSLAAARASS